MDISRILAALAHPARLEILRQLCGCGCACCGQMKDLTGLAQSTTSQHLRVLLEAGLIERRPAGTASQYRLSADAADLLRQTGEAIVDLAPSTSMTDGQTEPESAME
ncbi:helix-turn-helix transcriptional regulator [Notoacmeibacter sp. MSK16QG-6]|uniref:ArsR/SmtB family transcription factor n=1 Tax=Notoacmeibacter sp. MSK16QG-6 TaxID=2957982 RepID=UPI0020A06BA7|nr:metalloregulator ArsR/SmtB family transcription factor [Notoacmeibacter sp. MSK16QG-6]MCP1198006.1 metalloregulator ArsR/SmtB family transcription factor [Notoacmeibacter sp. MSK16QG-6]